MVRFRDDIQAINVNQAGFAVGMVAAADINHLNLRHGSMSPTSSGKRRRLPKRPYLRSTWPATPALERGCVPSVDRDTDRCRPLQAAGTGTAAAALWATLVIQRALSS